MESKCYQSLGNQEDELHRVELQKQVSEAPREMVTGTTVGSREFWIMIMLASLATLVPLLSTVDCHMLMIFDDPWTLLLSEESL